MTDALPKRPIESRAIWGGWITGLSAVLPFILGIFGLNATIDPDQIATLWQHIVGAIDNVMAAVGIVLIVTGLRGAKRPIA